MASIGETLAARLAGPIADMNMVTKEKRAEKKINPGVITTVKFMLFPLINELITGSIRCKVIVMPPIPANIPIGIAINAMIQASL